jgi:hypothetical protein
VLLLVVRAAVAVEVAVLRGDEVVEGVEGLESVLGEEPAGRHRRCWVRLGPVCDSRWGCGGEGNGRIKGALAVGLYGGREGSSGEESKVDDAWAPR